MHKITAKPKVSTFEASLFVDALVCLRMAMKMNEDQETLYRRYVVLENDEDFIKFTSPYQHILDLLTTQIISVREDLFGKQGSNMENLREEVFEKKINLYIQNTEYNILYSCEYNLNIGTGYELIHMIMDMACDMQYDFKQILKVIHQMTVNNMFFDQERLNSDNSLFKIGYTRQST